MLWTYLGSCCAVNQEQHLNRQEERPQQDGWVSSMGTVQGVVVNKSSDEAAGAEEGIRV